MSSGLGGSRMLPDAETLARLALRLGVTLVVAFLMQRLLFLIVGRFERLVRRAGGGDPAAIQRSKTLGSILRSLCTFVVATAALVHALEIFGWNVAPLLAGAGVLGVAVGFGAQWLVRDVISGLFILMENQYGVGDVIDIGDRAATVETLTVRSTTLRDVYGFVHYVPNGEMRTVTNRSRGWNRALADVVVASDQDAVRALEICRAEVRKFNEDPAWKDRVLEPAELWGIESLTGDEIRVRVSARTRPGADSAHVARELRQRLHTALLSSGIRSDPRRERAGPAAVATDAITAMARRADDRGAIS